MVNMAMTASNDNGNPVLNNMGGRCQLSRTIDPSAKTMETHGFCTYVDSAGDQIFEQCDFVPGAPNKCKLTGGTGKFEGLEADLVITAGPLKNNLRRHCLRPLDTKRARIRSSRPTDRQRPRSWRDAQQPATARLEFRSSPAIAAQKATSHDTRISGTQTLNAHALGSSSGLQQQAGHMTASDLCAARQMISCQAGAIHT